ncbi:MAG: lysophospholipid acyltransferase family protein [Sporichthyaceae bacterium]
MAESAAPKANDYAARDRVYPPVIAAAKVVFRALNLRVTVVGGEHMPRTGPVVLASNHVSYLDFILAGWGAQPSGRLVRFMAKESVFNHRISGPLMRGMKHIPVDRDAGSASFREALKALKAGEVVGVFPEATISRSFTVKEIKSGAVRMAVATKAPVVPVAVWGGQRLWTKGRAKNLLQRNVRVLVYVGEPLHPARGEDPTEQTELLRTRMQELLDRAQKDYPQAPASPDEGWWLPAHLGGSAPTPDEARMLDADRSPNDTP